MQSTGQTSTQALSFTLMHGSAMTYGVVPLLLFSATVSSPGDEAHQPVPVRAAREFLEGHNLHLPDSLSGQPISRTDRLQRLLSLHADPEPESEDLSLPWRKGSQRPLNLSGKFLALYVINRRKGGRVLQEVPEVTLLPDG